jgi:hypothetical protein
MNLTFFDLLEKISQNKNSHKKLEGYQLFASYFCISRLSCRGCRLEYFYNGGTMTRHYFRPSGNKFPVLPLPLKPRSKINLREYGVSESTSVCSALLPLPLSQQNSHHRIHRCLNPGKCPLHVITHKMSSQDCRQIVSCK